MSIQGAAQPHGVGRSPQGKFARGTLDTRQFCRLQATGAGNMPPGKIPPSVTTQVISTPLRPMAWQQALAQHPHREWVALLLEGMQNRFRIGLNPTTVCRSSTRNHPSADKHPVVVSEYLREQVAVGYMLGPFSLGQCSGIIISSLGVVPKSTPGKFRVIIYLSRPDGHSVNDRTCRELTHVAYSSTEDAALLMHALGPVPSLQKSISGRPIAWYQCALWRGPF